MKHGPQPASTSREIDINPKDVRSNQVVFHFLSARYNLRFKRLEHFKQTNMLYITKKHLYNSRKIMNSTINNFIQASKTTSKLFLFKLFLFQGKTTPNSPQIGEDQHRDVWMQFFRHSSPPATNPANAAASGGRRFSP